MNAQTADERPGGLDVVSAGERDKRGGGGGGGGGVVGELSNESECVWLETNPGVECSTLDEPSVEARDSYIGLVQWVGRSNSVVLGY